MRAVVLQSNYLPWRGYFDLINSADVFVYYDEVQYTKNDWRNRNRICSKNGVHWLTIPIGRDAVKKKVSEVQLPDAAWQQTHFRTLSYSYRQARHFQQVEPLLTDFYKARTWDRLSELNRHCIESITRLLGISTTFRDSKDYLLEGDRIQKLIGLLQQVGATEYLTGPSARAYLAGHEDAFGRAGIGLVFKSYDGYREYPQLHSPFEPSVSIVDLLANVPLSECTRYLSSTQSTT
jgi:hypothetical protein